MYGIRAVPFVKGKTDSRIKEASSSGDGNSRGIAIERGVEKLSGSEIKTFYEDLVGLADSHGKQLAGDRESLDIQKGHVVHHRKSKKRRTCSTHEDAPSNRSTYSVGTITHSRLGNKYLLCAKEGDFLQIKDMLKNKRIDINFTDEFGWNALMCAAESGKYNIVKYLLKLGMKADMSDNKGRTACDIAKLKKHDRIVNLLKRYKEHGDLNDETSCVKKAAKFVPFYCDECQHEFTDTTQKQHVTSTLHLFNCKKAIPRTHYFLPESNRGFQLMMKSGWNKEKGLGSVGQGQKFPVKTVLKRNREGLGVSSKGESKAKAKVTHFAANDQKAIKGESKERKLKITTISKRQRKKKLTKEKEKERNFRQEFKME